MHNYDNNQPDPKTSSYAFNCAMILILATVVSFGFIFYIKEIVTFILIILVGIGSALKFIFVTTKPFYEHAALYVTLFFLIVSMWTLCVFGKIEQKYENSKRKWKTVSNYFFGFFTILVVYILGADCLYLNVSHFYFTLLYPVILVVRMNLIDSDKDKKKKYQAQVRKDNVNLNLVKFKNW